MSQISGLGSNLATNQAGTDAYSKLTSGDFVKIIISELSRQDPLKPNDSSQLVQDMSNLRSIQANVDLTTKLDSIVGENQLASASAMIGKFVSGLDDRFNRVNGRVVSVSKTADGPVLRLDNGARVPFDTIDTLRETA